MKTLDKLNQMLGFTPTERRVVLFLAVTFLAGIGIKIFKPATGGEAKFDYSSSDSEFIARSQSIPGRDSSRIGEQREDEATSKPSPHLVDINTASRDELIQLPGVGEAMADRIIRYRKEHGLFTSMNDLANVKGIGKKNLQRIVPFCTLRK